MADNRIEFELAMKDDATKVMNNFKANVNTQSVAVQQAFQKMQGATAQSTNALMNFNRVISDAPYGIMGVANNINPLVESFQRLKAQSGSTGTALMSMIQGLASPAGIGVLVAAVSSLAVVFGKDLFNSVDNTNKKLADYEERILNAKIASGEFSKAMRIDLEEMKIAQAEADLFRLTKTVIDLKATATARGRGEGQFVYKVIGTPTEFAEVQARMEEARANIVLLTKEIDKDIERAEKKAVSLNAETKRITSGKGNGVAGQSKNMGGDDLKEAFENEKKMRLAFANWKLDLTTQEEERKEQAYQSELQRLRGYQQTAFTIFQSVGQALGESLAGQDANARETLKRVANMFITMAEAALFASSAIAAAKSIATFGASLVTDGPKLLAAFVAMEAGRAVVNKMHTGGTVGNFQNQPAGREFPIMVRGGETVRTEGQERDLQNNMGKGRGVTVNVNINGKGLAPRDVQQAIIAGMRSSGLTVDKYLVNNRSKIALA